MTGSDVEGRLRRIQWPRPSPRVRARVLSTATIPAGQVTWSDRVWFSRGWRLAAAMAVAVTLAAEAFSSAIFPRRVVETTRASAEVQAVDELGRDVGLPSALTAALARKAVVSAARRVALERQAVEVEEAAR